MPLLEKKMQEIGKIAKITSKIISNAKTQDKNNAINIAASIIRNNINIILSANDIDIKNAYKNKIPLPLINRLILDKKRINNIADSLESIAKLKDPIGIILSEWTCKNNGLHIKRKCVPLGVIGIIYESRPNVTADAGALCIKSGNATILRGGSDSIHSSKAILNAMHEGLKKAGLPINSIQMIKTTNRTAVKHMLNGLNGNIDVIIPRGGKSLVKKVQKEARIPVFSHLEGICHIYVDETADIKKSISICLNAKMRRPEICGSAETLLINNNVKKTHLLPIINTLQAKGCKIRGDSYVQKINKKITLATNEDWSTEYLDAIISIKIVNNIQEAIDHINSYGSHHTDAIISQDKCNILKFFNEIDSAIVMHNTSTQFADGGEFGMGAEIGISTGKMHARGPVGVEQLTSFKYIVSSNGEIRT